MHVLSCKCEISILYIHVSTTCMYMQKSFLSTDTLPFEPCLSMIAVHHIAQQLR